MIHLKKNSLLVTFILIVLLFNSCDLEKKQSFEEIRDCSNLIGVSSYWKGIQPWNSGEWVIDNFGYSGQCWATSSDCREARISFTINQEKKGVLRYYVNSGEGPNEVLLDGVSVTQVETNQNGGYLNYTDWKQIQIGPINPGVHEIKMNWSYQQTNRICKIDELTQMW